MAQRLRSRRGLTLLALVVVVAAVAAALAALTGSGKASTTRVDAGLPKVYMIGSVTNNTFWAAVKVLRPLRHAIADKPIKLQDS